MSTQRHGPKTSIDQVPVCNKKLYKEVAAISKMEASQVEHMATFVGAFVAATMKEGLMQSVMIPYFGKFRPKVDKLRQAKQAEHFYANGMSSVVRALKTGKAPKPKEPPHETL